MDVYWILRLFISSLNLVWRVTSAFYISNRKSSFGESFKNVLNCLIEYYAARTALGESNDFYKNVMRLTDY